MPARFYCPDPPRDGRLQLNADESRHLIRVCRLGVGDRIEVSDGPGFRGEGVSLCVLEAQAASSSPPRGTLAPEAPLPCSLILATAVPKGERFDWLIEKATELGVERLIPLVTDRSVDEPRVSKLERLRRSIIEASK